MKVTLSDILSYFPCPDRLRYGLQHADPLPADDEPFPITRVLDVNGLNDTLWLLSEMGEQRLLVRFACGCAERAVERHWEPDYPGDRCPQEVIAAARRWLAEPTEKNRLKARAAAHAHEGSADSAVYAAAKAARAAATAAEAASAAEGAADAEGDREWQIEYLRKLLEEAASAAAENKIWRFLLGFACDCAERAVERHWEPEYPDDRRPQEVIAAARRWLAEPTAENLSKADAAVEAAIDAARRWVESPTAENRAKAHAAATQAAYGVAYEDAAEAAQAAVEAAEAAAHAHLADRGPDHE